MAEQARRGHGDSPEGGRERLWAALRPGLDAHPVEPGALGEYALLLQERGPGPAERAFPDVAAHLRAGCDQCAADLRDFPFELERRPAFEGLRRLFAVRLEGAPSAGAAARGVGAADVHSYRAGDISVSVSVFGGPRAYTVEGLVRPADAASADVAGAPARLSPPDGSAYAAEIDELGNFSFEEVASGRYELEVGIGDVVVVADLVVGDAPGDAA